MKKQAYNKTMKQKLIGMLCAADVLHRIRDILMIIHLRTEITKNFSIKYHFI